jgi:cation transport ATPase
MFLITDKTGTITEGKTFCEKVFSTENKEEDLFTKKGYFVEAKDFESITGKVER